MRYQLRKCSYFKKEDIVKLDANSYKVPSESTPERMYDVEVTLGFCSCEMGRLGKFCKQPAGVYEHFQENFPNSPAITAQSKYLMAKLAFCEENVMPISFYEPLRATEIPSTSASESGFERNNDRNMYIKSRTNNLMTTSEEYNNDSSKEFIEFMTLLQAQHNTYGTSPKVINLCNV